MNRAQSLCAASKAPAARRRTVLEHSPTHYAAFATRHHMPCIASIPESRMPSPATKGSLAGSRGGLRVVPTADGRLGLGIVYAFVTYNISRRFAGGIRSIA
jgi:hypothetical protein